MPYTNIFIFRFIFSVIHIFHVNPYFGKEEMKIILPNSNIDRVRENKEAQSTSGATIIWLLKRYTRLTDFSSFADTN